MQRQTIEFFGAMRKHGRKNTNKNPQSNMIHGVNLDELTFEYKGKIVKTRPPAMADLMLYSLLCTFRDRKTGMMFLSQAGAAERLCLSKSTVSDSWKWLLNLELVYKHDEAPIARRMIRSGRGHYVNLWTIFDLPGRRFASGTVFEDPQDEFKAEQYQLEANGQQRGW